MGLISRIRGRKTALTNQADKFSEVANPGGTFIVNSTKWYGKFWPPERKKIRLMQALVDYQTPEIEKRFYKEWRDYLVYGKPMSVPAGDWQNWKPKQRLTQRCAVKLKRLFGGKS